MRIAFISPEVAPWARSGGLADVAGALPPALLQASDAPLSVAVFLPLYRSVHEVVARRGQRLQTSPWSTTVRVGGQDHTVALRTLDDRGVTVGFVDCPALFDRDGLYGSVGAYAGGDFPDNAARFMGLCKAVLELAPEVLGGVPDVLHGNDWQSAPALVLARTSEAARYGATRTVLTLHNLAYQGVFPPQQADQMDLDPMPEAMSAGGGWVNWLRAGIRTADVVTTVSPTYAREILLAGDGSGLERELAAREEPVVGLVNGIDAVEWDPAHDEELVGRFAEVGTEAEKAARKANRAALARDFALPIDDGDLVLGIVSRVVAQKGLDLLGALVPHLERLRARLVVLGTGEPELENYLKRLAEGLPERMSVRIEFDVGRSHRLFAGADAFLMPSRFEPCGLSQLYAMRYGTVPVVAPVGGLLDTVEHGVTGLHLDAITGPALVRAVERLAAVFHEDPERWQAWRAAGMARDSSWSASARGYLEVYAASEGGSGASRSEAGSSRHQEAGGSRP